MAAPAQVPIAHLQGLPDYLHIGHVNHDGQWQNGVFAGAHRVVPRVVNPMGEYAGTLTYGPARQQRKFANPDYVLRTSGLDRWGRRRAVYINAHSLRSSNWTRYVNTAPRGQRNNVEFVRGQGVGDRGGRVYLRITRPIKAGEELFAPYRYP
jgi:hypothetical protein